MLNWPDEVSRPTVTTAGSVTVKTNDEER